MLTLWLRLAGKTLIIEITIVKRNIFSDANEAGVGASLAPPSPEAEVQAQQEDPHPMDDDLEVFLETLGDAAIAKPLPSKCVMFKIIFLKTMQTYDNFV